MKIGILSPISHTLPPKGYAPWEKVVHTLAKGLTQKGIDVTVFAAADSKSTDYKISTTVDMSLINMEDFKFQQEMIHISETIRQSKGLGIDLVHNNINWYGQSVLQHSGLNFLTTIHGFEPPSSKYFNYYKTSNYVSISYAERKHSPGLNYIANVYNGIDFNNFKLNEEKKDYFFTAARICRDKGIHNAIKLAKLTKTTLYICGIIQDQKYFDEEVKPHVDENMIYFLGNISQEEVYSYVSQAKAYISILEFDEPFGLSVGEAIACGTPIIANRKGSMVELVQEGISGILVENVEDAAKRINEIEKISPQACREYGFNLFSVDKMIDGYLEAYEKILN